MTLKERFDQLEPREQRLLGILVVVFAVMAALLVPILVFATVSSRAEDNALMREAIDRIHAEKGRLGLRDAERRDLERRYATPAPPLAGYLDKAANEVGIDIPESQDRAMIPHGKKFEERSTKLVLKKVGMLSLVNYLEKVENSGYPVRVSALNVRKRAGEDDSFDVNLTISAFDRKETKAQAAKPSGDDGEEGEQGE
jgi:general secretion pathway protein M